MLHKDFLAHIIDGSQVAFGFPKNSVSPIQSPFDR